MSVTHAQVTRPEKNVDNGFRERALSPYATHSPKSVLDRNLMTYHPHLHPFCAVPKLMWTQTEGKEAWNFTSTETVKAY